MGPKIHMAQLTPVLVIYPAAAVSLTWLGIGSIMARRWARALLLIFSWSWLGVGVFIVICIAYFLPHTLATLPTTGPDGRPQEPLPPGAVASMLGFVLLLDSFFFIVLPGLWTFFYASRHTRLTCEWRDPSKRWTDACPLPVLGLCLYMIFCAVSTLGMSLAGYGVAPAFGVFLTGVAGTSFYLILSTVWAVAAYLLFRLDARGWWLALAFLLLFSLSAIITYSVRDAADLYRQMNLPDDQIAQIQRSGVITGNHMAWVTGLGCSPMLIYLLLIKRYMRPTSVR